MTKARDHYEQAGWSVEDTSKNNPFDLLCTREGKTRRVEVKATTTAGEVVLVTVGEVSAALDTACETDLFVVRNVEVRRDGTRRVLAGSDVMIISPWRPEPADLQPTQFRHVIRSRHE